MKIYHATENSLEEVASWINTERDCRIWGGPFVSYPIKLNALIKEIDFRPDNSYIFKVQENIVAFAQVLKHVESKNNHLARLIINPKRRGEGYGFRLCKTLIALTKESGRVITLNVYRNNLSAMALYKKLGFIEDKEKSNDSNVFMIKQI